MGTHLWFVLTDPDPDTRLVVMVMLVTERTHTDRTVRLEVGDHTFISRATNVDYGGCRFVPLTKLERALETRRASLNSDASTALLRKLREGLLASSHTPHAIVDHCRPLFGILANEEAAEE